MTTYKRGEVVIVPFPYTDRSGYKKRPAVIVSSDTFNNSRQDCIVIPISGRLVNIMPEDYTLKDWSTAGLLKPSIAKAILLTVHQNTILSRLGHLSDHDLKNIGLAIRLVLDLQP